MAASRIIIFNNICRVFIEILPEKARPENLSGYLEDIVRPTSVATRTVETKAGSLPFVRGSMGCPSSTSLSCGIYMLTENCSRS